MIQPREKYTVNNQLIYEWEQTLEEVNIYFFPPKWALPKYRLENIQKYGNDFKQKKITVKIQPNHLKIQVEGEQPFIDVK